MCLKLILEDTDENDEWDDISSNSSADMVTDTAEMEIDETNVCTNEVRSILFLVTNRSSLFCLK